MKKLTVSLRVLLLSLCALPVVNAQEILTIETQITGSKEQPKVLSIVPWQNTKEPDYFGDDIRGLDDEATGGSSLLDPINRASFLQEVKYISSMRADIK